MLALLSWIPIIGPIIDGVFGWLNKKQDVELERIKTDGQTNLQLVTQLTELQKANADDIGTRLCRDLVMFPVGLWTALCSWDTIVALNHPHWMIHLADYPPGLQYLPYAVIAYLFGALTLPKMFRR